MNIQCNRHNIGITEVLLETVFKNALKTKLG